MAPGAQRLLLLRASKLDFGKTLQAPYCDEPAPYAARSGATRVAHRPLKLARLRGVGFLEQQSRLEQRLADARDFRIADLGERRPHDGALLAAEQH